MTTQMTPEQIAWVKRWRERDQTLKAQHDAELAALTDEAACRQVEAVLSMPITWRDPARWQTSGLVEQQRLFARARKT